MNQSKYDNLYMIAVMATALVVGVIIGMGWT